MKLCHFILHARFHSLTYNQNQKTFISLQYEFKNAQNGYLLVHVYGLLLLCFLAQTNETTWIKT